MAVNYMNHFDMKDLALYQEGGALLPCPDQWMGELEVKDSQMVFHQFSRDSINYLDDDFALKSLKQHHSYNIVFIMESPHLFEYDRSGQPLGLIMGQSGCHFFDMFADLLSKSRLRIKPRVYDVICINAIQYQCSCGTHPLDSSVRDSNWLEIFHQRGGKEDLRKRIFALKPRYTINLCTGGKHPKGLRTIVSDALIEWGLKKGRHFTEGNHPASWNMNGNKKNAIIY